jgi:hypothetical protein
VDLRGRSIDREPGARWERMEAIGYYQTTLHPWTRAGVKDTCLAAIASHEDGTMHDGKKWAVAVVTRVLLATPGKPGAAAGDGGAPAAGDAGPGAEAPAAPIEVRRTKKGYLEGDGLVWAIQYELLPRPK